MTDSIYDFSKPVVDPSVEVTLNLHESCKPCPQCSGKGTVPVWHHNGTHHLEICERCGGIGAVSKYR